MPLSMLKYNTQAKEDILPPLPNRLLSLDFLRGFIMVLLALESTELYSYIAKLLPNKGENSLINQFFHHPWHGLHFWDLIQPIFMFLAGVSMAFSLKKHEKELSWNQSFVKVLKRCGWLFFWGVLDYMVRINGLSFELWDILTQLSFTTLITFLVAKKSPLVQFSISLLFLIIPEFLYRFTHIPGFNQAFVDQHNFGNYMDMVLMGKINHGGWVAINCLSTTAHTLWGLMAGQLLLREIPGNKKLGILLLGALVGFLLGFGLDLLGITPIIKRIATSSFVLASGGFCLLFLSISYWWIDLLKHQKNLFFFTVVGMNSLFIYLFFEIIGDRWFNGYINAIIGGFSNIFHFPLALGQILSSLTIFALEWSLCLFLYKKRIFFKA